MKLSNLNIFYIWLCFFFPLVFGRVCCCWPASTSFTKRQKETPKCCPHTELWPWRHRGLAVTTQKNVLSCRSFIADILNSNFLYSHLLCPSEREVSLADIIDRGKHKFLFLIKFDKSFLFVSSDVSEMRLFMSFTLFVDMSRSIIVDES